jgi:GNAT superfamily N-acetyltransferase
MEIRIANNTDVPQLLELYKELQQSDPPNDIDAAIAVLEKAMKNDVKYFVADNYGHIVGTCYIAIIPNITRQCSSIGFIENIVTAAEYRRMGIGRKLLQTAIEYAKKRGCYKVMLSSGIARSEAHDFYESLGFDGNSKKTYEMRF